MADDVELKKDACVGGEHAHRVPYLSRKQPLLMKRRIASCEACQPELLKSWVKRSTAMTDATKLGWNARTFRYVAC